MIRELSVTTSMNIHPSSTWKDVGLEAQRVVRQKRRRLPSSAQSVLFSILGTFVAIFGPALFAVGGVGMSRQSEDVASGTALAALLAIICGFVTVRRVLGFPLVRTYSYVALTFVATFALVAIGLKFFRINFSSPQFFLGMVMIVGQVELFLYAHRHRAPLHIAVVPGGAPLANLPRTLLRPIKVTVLGTVPSAEFDYNSVVADLGKDLTPEWKHFLALSALQGVPVYHVKQFNESITGRVTVDHLWENTLGAIVPSLIYPQFKRALDFLGALFLLPFIAPIIGICAVVIKLETPGPIFYPQCRTGLGGKPFTIYKLRTMMHKHDGENYTVENDTRITRVGRFLRQYHIDELPQIFNILRGNMSWIGPRPEAIPLAEWYEREVPFYVYRHIVRPGLSGWAQVHQGNVAAVDAARLKLEYDFFYIKNFSFWLDVVIFIKTVRAIVTRFGWR